MEVYKPAIISSAIFCLLGVIIGAFGAHKLKEIFNDADLLNSFETGVRYQFYHAFALAFVGILYAFFPGQKMVYATWMFILGIILFSGSIYVLTILKSTQDIGLGKLGLITPLGGTFFIVGWIFVLAAVLKK